MALEFRNVVEREMILIKGPEGWGEFSPFPGYGPEVTARWLAAALEAACQPLPDPVRTTVPVNVTVPAVDPQTAARLVTESGASTAKVKVAAGHDNEESEMARLQAVSDALGPGGRLRIDVNGAWSLDEATRRLEALRVFDLEYVEQPVAAIADMVRLRARVDVPVAADESVRTSTDPMEVVAAGGADLLVLKVQPLGGVWRTLDLAARSGLPVVISSALESSVGLSHGVRAAASLPELPYACGLGTAQLLGGDVTSRPLMAADGVISYREIEPDELPKWRADTSTAQGMMRRLRAAAELLT
ncbi:MAG: o-succinylbenzoate synthase [Acidimicrobiia bacterium]|nr:o-succinylbenzoate synthase [Acidimicrobiia bacterium]